MPSSLSNPKVRCTFREHTYTGRKTVSRESDTTTEFSPGEEGMGRVIDGQQGKENTCLLTDLISALFSTPTEISKTHHHYGLEGKAVIHALRVNQINCCTAEAHRCAQGDRERTGWIIRTVFVQLFLFFVLWAQNSTQAQILLHRFYLRANHFLHSAWHSDFFKKQSWDENKAEVYYFILITTKPSKLSSFSVSDVNLRGQGWFWFCCSREEDVKSEKY